MYNLSFLPRVDDQWVRYFIVKPYTLHALHDQWYTMVFLLFVELSSQVGRAAGMKVDAVQLRTILLLPHFTDLNESQTTCGRFFTFEN